MGSNKSDKYVANSKLYDYYQSVAIALDVEYIMLIAHIISSVEIHSDI